MKKIVFAISLFLIAADVIAEEYKSSFGFRFQLPETWAVATKEEIRKSGNNLSAESNIPLFRNISREKRQMMIDKIKKSIMWSVVCMMAETIPIRLPQRKPYASKSSSFFPILTIMNNSCERNIA